MSTATQTCSNHCGHDPDWMRYDEDFEAVRCAYPVGHACDFCGGLECGHQCTERDAGEKGNEYIRTGSQKRCGAQGVASRAVLQALSMEHVYAKPCPRRIHSQR